MARLKKLRGGVPYRYLWRRHFPGLRASEVFISATLSPIHKEEPAAVPEIIVTEPVAEADTVETTPADTIFVVPAGGYLFAIKTNGLYDAMATPALGIEFPVGEHLSVGANWMYAWWKNHDRNRHWRVYGGDINARYYFGNSDGRPMTGHHVGVYAQVLLFQIAFGGKGYITGIPGQNLWGKPYMGGGVEYGYSKRIGKRLNLDFTLGLGYMAGEYRTYRPKDGHYVWQSTHRRNWLGPTKAEVSLVWLVGKMPRKEVAR